MLPPASAVTHLPNLESPALRVLVVEDEPLIRWSVAETLAHAGHTVVEAGDKTTALRALTDASHPVDVVLLDYQLPDSNDLSLLANVRRLVPESAVVMMTAHSAPEIAARALELGVYRVVSKPFDMQDLEGVVLQAYQARRP